MRETRKKRYALILHFTFLIVLLSSFTNNRSSNNQSSNGVTSDTFKSNKSEIDTTLRLKFTSMVRSIFEDSKGNIWFGSDKEGVCRYDGKSFTYFTVNNGLGHNQVRTIQEDLNGNIWFATGSGVSSYDGEKIIIHASKNNTILSIDLEKEWKKEATDLWFNRETEGNGVAEGGIYRYDNQNLTALAFPSFTDDYDGFNVNGTITAVSKGMNNMLWIASYGGVFGYDGRSFHLINESGIKYHVRGILEDSKGNLWIGNNGIGVLCYDGNTTVKLSDKNGLGTISPQDFPYHVFTIAEDRHGNIWIGDRDSGTWCYDGKTLKNYTTEHGLTSMFVRVIYKDKKGELWFGLEDGSVCKFNGKSFDKIF